MCDCDFAACNEALTAGSVCANRACAAPACVDGVQNGTETALDAGGDCAACADGLACNAPAIAPAACRQPLCRARLR